MIVAEKIAKRFGHRVALDCIDFSIKEGEFISLLGVNGAGKTTLIRILATLSRPTSGNASIAGFRIDKAPENVRRHIGLMSHVTFLYGELTAEENLLFYGRMYSVTGLRQRTDELLQRISLNHRRFDLVRTFSRGMQQRLSLARSILHDPDVLLLDEPFAGLDVNATQTLTELIGEFTAQGTTVLLTTHNVEFALTHAHRILLLDNGRITFDTPTSEVDAGQITALLSADKK